jgi:hypothetical protein
MCQVVVTDKCRMNSEYKIYIQIVLHGAILVFKTYNGFSLKSWLLTIYTSVWLI